MATITPNLGLTEPAYTDNSDIQVLNGNFTLIDSFAGTITTGAGAAPTKAVQSDATAPSGGVAPTLLRSDAQLVAFTLPPGLSLPGQPANQGTQIGVARSDHQHQREQVHFQNQSLGAVGTSEIIVAQLAIPTSYLQAGSTFRVRGLANCIAAGTATYSLRFGTAGTTADTALNSSFGGAMSLNTFGLFEVLVNFLSTGGSSQTITSMWFMLNGGTINGVAAGQNNALPSTVGATFLTLTCHSTVANSIQTYGVQMEQVA